MGAGKEEKPLANKPNTSGLSKPGMTNNPSGRPKIPDELKARLKSLCPEVVEKWLDIMRNGKDVDALSASEKIWFATYGKFVQQVENVDETGSTVPNEILIRFVKNKET